MSNKEHVMEQYDESKLVYMEFASSVKRLLDGILRGADIVCNAVTYRVKDRESLSRKIDCKNDKYSDLSEVTDIAGVRIITYYADDVDRIATLVEREFKVDKENSIDKRKALEPDRFGYCSVHYVVEMNESRLALSEYQMFKGRKCEIQIRSVLQHAWAEIEHDLGYKSAVAIPQEVRRNFSRLAGLLEIADKEFKEIRQILTSYKTEVEEKITVDRTLPVDDSFRNTEIDAVVLDTLVKNNPELTQLTKSIVASFKGTMSKKSLEPNYWDITIKRLQYFDIITLGQLLDVVHKRKDLAVRVAKEMAKHDKKKDGVSTFSASVCFFYLCYAELLSGNPTDEEITRYLEKAKIKADAVKKLVEIRNQLVAPSGK